MGKTHGENHAAMNWLAISQAALNAILAFAAFYLTIHPVSKRTKQWRISLLKISLWLAVLTTGILAYRLSNEADGAQDKVAKKLAEVSSKLSELDGLRKQYASLVDNVITNNSLSTEARQAVLNSDATFQQLNAKTEDLSEWLEREKSAYKDRVVSEQLKLHSDKAKGFAPVAENYLKGYQYFAYTMESFTNILMALAARKGDSMECNYKGLPRSITYESPNPEQIAEFNFKKDSHWRFTVALYPVDATLTIFCEGSHLATRKSGDGEIEVPGIPLYHFQYSTNDFKAKIDQQLHVLVASRDAASSKQPDRK